MELVSISPLPAGSLLWRPRPGAWMFTFACKATFTLRPVQCPLAPEQEPLHEADRHWSDDPSWSLYAPTDLVPIRPRADVVLIGEAYAPPGSPVRSLVARLLVGDIDKSVEVHADRWFTQDGVLQEGTRFTRMPLLWERAAGGPDTTNPVGVLADDRDLYGRRALPHLQPPGAVIASPDAIIEPIGFGPIASAWPTRRQRLGRYAATWSDRDWIRQPLPPDLDATYFNAAPRDQQTQAIRDNERIVLDHLHPEHPHLVTNLSGHSPRAFAVRPGKPPQPILLRAELLWIDSARSLCTLTWRGQIPLLHPQEQGSVLLALEDPGQELTWPDLDRLAAARGASFREVLASEDRIRNHGPAVSADVEVTSPAPIAAAPATPAPTSPAGEPLPAAAPLPAVVSPPPARPSPSPAIRSASQPAAEAREILHLIWFDPESVPRFRRQHPWRDLLKELENKPPDSDLDAPTPAEDGTQVHDRRDVFEILARAVALHAEGLSEALEGAERDDGKFVPPLRLLSGDLVLSFSEIETLKTTVAIVTPFRSSDENLRAAVNNAQEILKLAELQSAPLVAEGLTARIREAWSHAKRPVAQTYLAIQCERALLEQRSYQRRRIFGGKHLRVLLQPAASQELVPAYLPEDLAETLPLYARFKVRLIAELHAQVDQHETHPAALKVLALARVTPSLRRR